MKKIIIILFCITIVVLSISTKDNILIPEDSIRYRIIANSNSKSDQEIKWNLNEQIMPVLNDIMVNSTTLDSARTNIYQNLNNIKSILNTSNQKYNINYGNNYFPEKKYNNVKYNAGNYESLVITLGDGNGDNFWCVMFPPLCLLEVQKDNVDDVKYSFFVKEIINNYS